MYNYTAKLVRVIDGDSIIVDIDLGFSIWIKNKSVRLLGVDTPELRTKDNYEKKAAILAKERVEGLLTDGTLIITTVLDKQDKFGRILGTLYTNNGDNINNILIEEKLGIKWNGQNTDDRLREHYENLKWLISEGKITI
jgi:micrococcal nuclease